MTTTAATNRNKISLEELVGRLMDALRWERVPAQGAELAGQARPTSLWELCRG